ARPLLLLVVERGRDLRGDRVLDVRPESPREPRQHPPRQAGHRRSRTRSDRSAGLVPRPARARPPAVVGRRLVDPARPYIESPPMKAHTAYMTFETEDRRELIRITEDVQAAVDEAGVAEGMVLVSAMHITAGVWVNDDEPGLHADTLEWLDKVAPPS